MKSLASLLACGLFAATFLSGCIGYYERAVESPVLVPVPPSPPSAGASQRRNTSKEERCITQGAHRYCLELDQKVETMSGASSKEAPPYSAMCATPGKWEWNGVQWVCGQPPPKDRLVPSTFAYMTPACCYGWGWGGYPYGGYPFWGFGGYWGGALLGSPSVFYYNPQQPQQQGQQKK
ncbi:MAG: hypothetical protein G01um101449_315 [Parcubacteria group bacterium Gr01-1014_49]|nr:MAG: hypothetical protein G01um101449_315 [Parcubacteria group bacterium Gr01-1014_49]